MTKMVMKMTRCSRFQVRASAPPTWHAKDVARNHGHLWDQGYLAGSVGGWHVAQRAEERGTARQRSHGQSLPRLGPPRGVKPYSCFGGLMVENGGKAHRSCPTRLPRSESGYARTSVRGSKSFVRFPWASFYRSRGHHCGKSFIVH